MSDQGKVAVFWDYENCAPPLSSQGYSIVNRIRKIAHIFGRVTTFKTYLDMSVQPQHPRSISFRSELQSSGVSMIDCPHNGRKDVVDKMILVDMLAFAIDHHSPATVILIAGDRDYAYAMSTLRLRQYNVVLIVPSANIPESLMSQASVVIDWSYAILRKRPEADTPPVRQPYPDLDENILERLTREIQGSNGDPAATANTHVAQPALTDTPRKAASVFPETPAHYRVGSTLSRARPTTQPTQIIQGTDRDSGSDGSVADDHVDATDEIQDATSDPIARPHITSPRLERYHNNAEPPPTTNFPPSPSPSATFNLRSKTPLSHSRTISGGTPISYGNPLPQITVPVATSTSPAPTDGLSDTTSALKPIDFGSISAIMDDSILPSDHAAVMDAFGLDEEDKDGYSSDKSTNVSTNSSHLAEVEDDPSHTYATNAVQSLSNEGQASFRDIGRSPPVNDTSSLITDLSETPTSQQSSSAPSFSDPNVTMHNVEIGSPPQVMPSVIRHNSDSHFSAYHALPTESIEDRIRRLTPPQFLPLINQLLLARSRGNMKPRTSIIASALVRYGTDVYKRAGVTNFWDYATRAGQASLVELGEWEGDSWIVLHPNLFKEETAIESVEDKTRRLTPPQFLPLIDQLLLARSKGVVKPGRSTIAIALLQCDKDAYKRAGVTKFKEYASLAEQASLVELGGLQGDAWIGLHPNLLKEETTPKSLTPPTAHRSSSSAPQHNVDTSTQWTPSTPSPPHATIPNSNTPPLAVSDGPIPLCFVPLMTCLANIQKGGMTKPLRSQVGLVLGPAIYARAGVANLKEYLALATDAGVVECGGVSGYAWVRLRPDVLAVMGG